MITEEIVMWCFTLQEIRGQINCLWVFFLCEDLASPSHMQSMLMRCGERRDNWIKSEKLIYPFSQSAQILETEIVNLVS